MLFEFIRRELRNLKLVEVSLSDDASILVSDPTEDLYEDPRSIIL